MASAWGSSWGSAWGNSWGLISTQAPIDLGGGGYRHPGVTREMLRKYFADILKAIAPPTVPAEIKQQVRVAVKKTAEMRATDELSTEAAEAARAAVEQAWVAVRAKRIELETKLPLLEITWLLTLQQELSMLYAMIDDEEAALVLLMSV